MLTIVIPESDGFNEETNEFIKYKKQKIVLEHSLVSLSKWEARWKKPFLGEKDKTPEEALDYVRCMTITQNVSPEVYLRIPQNLMDQISDYIGENRTATTFNDKQGKGSRKVITSEVIYYQMTALNIPFDPCQKWHLSQLTTLIRVASIKNNQGKPTKRSAKAIRQDQAALNKRNRERFNSKG